MEIKINIVGAERKVKSTNARFIAWKAILKNGSTTRLKFRKEISNKIPQVEGRFTIVVNLDDVNLSTDDYGDVYWVSDIISFEETQRVTNLNKDDLPF